MNNHDRELMRDLGLALSAVKQMLNALKRENPDYYNTSVDRNGRLAFPELLLQKQELEFEIAELQEKIAEEEVAAKAPEPKLPLLGGLRNPLDFEQEIDLKNAMGFESWLRYRAPRPIYICGDSADTDTSSKFDPNRGLQPKQAWLNERLDAINRAIEQRLVDNAPIPYWWNDERAELLERIKKG